MQWAGDNHAVDILHVKQSATFVKSLNSWRRFFGFFPTTTVDIGDRYQLNLAQLQNLIQQFLTAPPCSDHPYAYTIIAAESPRRRIRRKSRRAQNALLHKI